MLVPSHKGNANQTTVRYHFTPSRMARIKKACSNKSWCGRGVVTALVHFRWKCNIAQLLWKAIQWLNIELLYDPTIPLPGKYPRELGTGVQTKMCTRMFTAVLFTTTRSRKQPKSPPADDWIHRGRCVHPVGHAAIKRTEAPIPAPTWMSLENTALGERSQTQKDTRCVNAVWFHLCEVLIHRTGKSMETGDLWLWGTRGGHREGLLNGGLHLLRWRPCSLNACRGWLHNEEPAKWTELCISEEFSAC